MKMTPGREGALTELVEAWANLARESARFGLDLVRSLAPSVSSAVSQVAAVTPRLPKPSTCSCTIPPACWLPVEAGDVRTSACAGAKATLRIQVTNCGAAAREIAFEAAAGAQVALEPGKLGLGPLERGTSTATVTVAEGDEQRYLIWVRGCKSHYVRWTVTAGDRCAASAAVEIEDCPDTVHHWYDHFYCQHPCQG
jgi:hypothetical protein